MSKTEPEVPLDVENLPAGTQQTIRDMLIEGAPFEDIVEKVNSTKGPTVTQMMVESYFRRNLEVQKGRVRRQVETAEELKKAIGNPETAEGELASAAFLTGFMRLTRKTSEIDLQDAEIARMRRANLDLERQVLQMKKDKQEKELAYMQARIRHEWAKFQVLREKLREIKAALNSLRRGDKLDTATLAKIREIYGIVSEPFVPPEFTAKSSEPRVV